MICIFIEFLVSFFFASFEEAFFDSAGGSLEIDMLRKTCFGKLFPWVFHEGAELASGITVLIFIIVLLWENEYVQEILFKRLY